MRCARTHNFTVLEVASRICDALKINLLRASSVWIFFLSKSVLFQSLELKTHLTTIAKFSSTIVPYSERKILCCETFKMIKECSWRKEFTSLFSTLRFLSFNKTCTIFLLRNRKRKSPVMCQ